ncbi:hypothetical protein MSAN_01114500 [Mycena sanguinolenta]|uniref:Uncharacterized protein n=1 Tax=Mycena sanguinolenta TaxID=230812 RepID=A0A8H7D6N5_9AGAR|nr:hypothetical protein MSAN_01114500 [Mycena sanguinolenta]
MAASSPLVQELWDEIIDYLHDSRPTLLSCALVCRALVVRAQTHLFRSIVVASHRHPTTISVTHLAEILSLSPHLIDYVCDLYIGRCDAATLMPIVVIAWSRMSAISFVHSSEEPVAPALDLLSALVSLPTLRKILFYSNAWTADNLCVALTACNPGISALAFHSCSPEISDLSVDDNPTTERSHRLRITHLDLFFADTIPDFMMNAACPLDLSGLQHVKVGFSGETHLFPFLYGLGHTIQSLDIDAADAGLDSLDLGSLPGLSHLTVRGQGSAVQHILQRSRESNVRMICYLLGSWRGSACSPILQSFQSSVLSANMPKLHRVEVKMIINQFNIHSYAEWTSLIRDSMSQLSKSGILAITFD